MKLIFLDIDGVLNWIGTEDRVGPFIGLDQERIQRFNKIIDAHPDAKIVVSSTWRKGMKGIYDGLDGLKKLLADRGLKGEIIGATPIRFSNAQRGHEIRDFLEDFQEPVDAFVILDDSDDGFDGHSFEVYEGRDDLGEDIYKTETIASLRPNHVKTFWDGEMHLIGGDHVTTVEGGLQDHHIEQAIKLLGQS